jgi:hypothetical protein
MKVLMIVAIILFLIVIISGDSLEDDFDNFD